MSFVKNILISTLPFVSLFGATIVFAGGSGYTTRDTVSNFNVDPNTRAFIINMTNYVETADTPLYGDGGCRRKMVYLDTAKYGHTQDSYKSNLAILLSATMTHKKIGFRATECKGDTMFVTDTIIVTAD